MGGVRLKPEPADVQGTCITEGCTNKQCKRSAGKYRPFCAKCHAGRIGFTRQRITYRSHKKDVCEECGFVPVHPCQLDVDHVDGNHKNDDPSNLRTLCANCHRLKTYLNGEHLTVY